MRSAIRWGVLGAIGAGIATALCLLLAGPASANDTTISIDTHSVGRMSSTGAFHWDVTGSASSYYAGTSPACTTGHGCVLALEAQMSDYSIRTLQQETVTEGTSSFSQHFVGDDMIREVVGVRVALYGSGGSAYTAWSAVTDSIPTPALAITHTAVTRNAATGQVHYDVTATASYFRVPGAICGDGSYFKCDLYIYMTDRTGTTTIVGAEQIPSDATSPHSLSVSGDLRSVAVTSVYAQLQEEIGWSGYPHVNSAPVDLYDPYPTQTVKVNSASTTRNPTNGKLHFTADVSASYFRLPDAVCGQPSSSCDLNLVFDNGNGTTTTVASTPVPADVDSPYTFHFDGEAVLPRAVAVRATITSHFGWYGNLSLTGDAIPVTTDDYPLEPEIELGESSFNRDPVSGVLSYRVPVTATGFTQNASACGTNADYNSSPCRLTLLVEYASAPGDFVPLDDWQYSGATAEPSYTFDSSRSTLTITAFKVAVAGGDAAHHVVYSDVVSVDDSYPTQPESTIEVKDVHAAGHGKQYFDVRIAGRGMIQTRGVACGPPDGMYYWLCRVVLEGKNATSGEWEAITSYDFPNGHGEPVYEFKGAWDSPRVTKVRVAFVAGNDSIQNVMSASVGVHDHDPTESQGGGNASEKGCQCGAKDPVNTATGEFYLPSADLALAGAGPAVAVSRTYSSLAATTDGAFGHGWSSSFDAHLDIVADDTDSSALPTQVSVVQENGATTPYYRAEDGTYPAAPWVTATLTRDAETGRWVFTRNHRDTLTFDSDGQLLSQSDIHGVRIEFTHDESGHVTKVEGTGNRTITLTWSGDHVTEISDAAGRSATYHYDAAGDLDSAAAIDGTTEAYTYDASHRMTTLTNPRGGVTTNHYDSDNRVTTQTDPLGRSTGFSYTDSATTITNADGTVEVNEYSQGTILKIVTAAGTPQARTATYQYDESQNRVATTDPLGNRTTSTFDGDGNALTTTDPLGRTTTRTFDAIGDVTSVTDPAGKTSTMTYSSTGELLSATTPGGHTTSATYNTDGTVASATSATGGVTTFTYDSAGRPLCSTDPDSRTTCVAYDTAWHVTSATDSAGKVTSFTVDAGGRVLTTTDPLNRTTTSVYDADGNRTSVTDPAGHTVSSVFDLADRLTSSTDAAGRVTSYGYDDADRPTTVTDPLGHTTTAAYDVLGQKVSVADGVGRTTTFGYDGAGRPTTTTLPSGAVTTTAYDAAGQVVSITDARSKITTFAYDGAGRPLSSTDPLNRTTTRSYTDDGLVDTVTLPGGSTTHAGYDAAGRQTSFTNADGKTTTNVFDPAGLLTSTTEPGALTTAYGYDTAGRVRQTTRPDGTHVLSSYDAAGQLTGLNYPGTASDVTYTYNADGSRATMTDATGTSSSTYTATGRTASVTDGSGQTIGYGYDDAGRLTSITYPGAGTLSYGWDAADEMTSATDWAGRQFTFGWTADGQQHTQTDPNGVTDTRAYDLAGNLTQIVDTTTAATLATLGYSYDDAGQLVGDTTGTASRSYGYDPLGQLTTTPTGTAAATPGGLLTTTPDGATQVFNAAQQLTSTTPPTGAPTTYTYDDNGSRLTATTGATTPTAASFGYDPAGNLSHVTTAGGTSVDYTTDGDGLRRSRTTTTGTDHLLWDVNASLPLLLDDGTHTYLYGPGTTPIAQIENSTGTIQYLHSDNLGSTRLITDSTGATVGTTDYSPYGTVTASSGVQSAVGYTGNRTDPTTGLVYLRARDYDPHTGQFLEVDLLVDQTRQPYTYTANAPLDHTDPTGLIPIGGPASNPFIGPVGRLASELPRIAGDLARNADSTIAMSISWAATPESAHLVSWATGRLPASISLDNGSAFSNDFAQSRQAGELQNYVAGELRSGNVGTGGSVSEYVSVGSPIIPIGSSPRVAHLGFTINPQLAKDLFVLATMPLQSGGDRAGAVVGSYDGNAYIDSIDRAHRTACVTFTADNPTTLGSALGYNQMSRNLLNAFAEFLPGRMFHETDQHITWTREVHY